MKLCRHKNSEGWLESPLAEGRELKWCYMLEYQHGYQSPLAEGRELKCK